MNKNKRFSDAPLNLQEFNNKNMKFGRRHQNNVADTFLNI